MDFNLEGGVSEEFMGIPMVAWLVIICCLMCACCISSGCAWYFLQKM